MSEYYSDSSELSEPPSRPLTPEYLLVKRFQTQDAGSEFIENLGSLSESTISDSSVSAGYITDDFSPSNRKRNRDISSSPPPFSVGEPVCDLFEVPAESEIPFVKRLRKESIRSPVRNSDTALLEEPQDETGLANIWGASKPRKLLMKIKSKDHRGIAVPWAPNEMRAREGEDDGDVKNLEEHPVYLQSIDNYDSQKCPTFHQIDKRIVKDPNNVFYVKPTAANGGHCWVMVKGCENCTHGRVFCDRGFPCMTCKKRGLVDSCVRRTPEEGLQKCPPYDAWKRPKSKRRASKLQRRIICYIEGPVQRKAIKPKLARIRNGVRSLRDKPIKAQKKEKIDVQADKPLPVGKPKIHAMLRQDLCESVPGIFRAYQSGPYTNQGFVRGYLLDGTPSPRDYMDGQIIISHCGGKSTGDDEDRWLMDDQHPDDNVVKCMLNNWIHKQPIAMIMGSQCPTSPTKMPYRYQLLDWFMVTHSWTEPDPISGHTRFKYRFEKVGLKEPSWWVSPGMSEKDEEGKAVPVVKEQICSSCLRKSPHIYLEGFICFHTTCGQFWKIDGRPAGQSLRYTEDFRNSRHPVPSDYTVPASLLPNTEEIFVDEGDGLGDATRYFWKGIICPDCGNCCARTAWKGWTCPCGYSRDTGNKIVYTARQLANPHRDHFTGPPVPQLNNPFNIPVKVHFRDTATIVRYDLGPNVGSVIHIHHSHRMNQHLGIDQLLLDYQHPDMPFKRNLLQTGSGMNYTRNFAFNCGKKYSYAVEQDTVKMEDAPEVIRKALTILNEQVAKECPEYEVFNEILSVGYLENMLMGWHTDDEIGLGPTVASLSLGAPADFRFRMRKDWKNSPECHLPGQDINSNKTPYLHLILNHGDILIMHGEGVQRFWEHTAACRGLFRIAATARFIDADVHNAATSRYGPKKKVKTQPSDVPIGVDPLKTELPQAAASIEVSSTYIQDFFAHIKTIPKKLKSGRQPPAGDRAPMTPGASPSRAVVDETDLERMSLEQTPEIEGSHWGHEAVSSAFVDEETMYSDRVFEKGLTPGMVAMDAGGDVVMQ